MTSTPTKRVLVVDDHPLRPLAPGVIQTAARRVEERDLPILGTRVNEVPPADIASVLHMPAYRLETRRWEMVQRIRQLTTNGNGRTMLDLSQPQRRPRRDEAQDVT